MSDDERSGLLPWHKIGGRLTAVKNELLDLMPFGASESADDEECKNPQDDHAAQERLPQIDQRTAHDRAFRYAWGDPEKLVLRKSLDAYLSFLEASGYVIVPVDPTQEMLKAAEGAKATVADTYVEMVAARPRLD